ncbi:MAG TPA: heat-inducible transcriptional repressor HrcA, partial [Deltaproteobacteria bacterium]|nr:heat-inducible transcriptional repressor HrcA [Deltaproteobacteria bacterium]
MGETLLDARQSRILRALVESYIQTAAPVGSGTLSKAPQSKLSAATIRNVMA